MSRKLYPALNALRLNRLETLARLHADPRRRLRAHQRLGAYLVPGLRLQDCEEAALRWLSPQWTEAKWLEFVEMTRREGRVRK